MSDIVTIQLDCGMPLIAQPIPNVASVALSWLIPAGSAMDPAHRDGQAAALAEIIFRGTGTMTSREHSDALDRLGVQRSSHNQTHHLQIEATLLGSHLTDALPLIAAMVTDPLIADDAVEPVRSLCLQSLEALNDDPQHRAMLRLRERHRPPPFNRHGYGDPSVLETITGEELREAWAQRSCPGGAILAAAGAVDLPELARQLNASLGGFAGHVDEPAQLADAARGYLHLPQDTAQVHIALAYDAPPEAAADSMLERLAVAVLSGSTSGRLFTEVRQKRSLCYSVAASYQAGRDTGLVALYAGTTPQRASDTLRVCAAEIERLCDGVDADEFQRAVTGLKSRLIMQGESTPARALALARDYFRLGRSRTLDELAQSIEAITLDELNRYLARRQFGPFTVVSIGPDPLPSPVSSDNDSPPAPPPSPR